MITSTFIFRSNDLHYIKNVIEKILDVLLEFRESSFRGGLYCYGSSSIYKEIIVEINFDFDDQEVIINGESGNYYIVQIYHDSKNLENLMSSDYITFIGNS